MDQRRTSRRTFARVLGAAAAGVWSLRLALGAAPSGPSAHAAAPSTPEPRSMNRRPIPRTKEPIPVIGLGTSGTFDVELDAEARQRIGRVLTRFHESGGRVVDTSPMYGRSEAVVGTLAAEARIAGDLFIATKVWTRGRDEGIRQMEASSRLLKRDRIDLMQVHNLIDTTTHLATLDAWKKEGRVRYTGITHYVPSAFDDLERVMREHKPDFVQLCYSVGRREAETRLLPLAADLGIAVLVNRPFEDGGLFRAVKGKPLPPWAAEAGCASWSQLFLKFILAQPAVTCVIPATGNPSHLEDNVAAGAGEPLTSEHCARLAALV
jgi:diketogulonate reductase-like aldo/keto reductase